MIVDFQCGDTITIPEGCKAIVKDGSVVFEREEKTEVKEFKDGDVLVDDFKSSYFPYKIILIYKGTKSVDGCYEYYINRSQTGLLSENGSCSNFSNSRVRHAIEEEKKELFDLMKENGLQWNAEEKRVEKIRWRAEEGKIYYYVNNEMYVSSTRSPKVGEHLYDYEGRSFFSYNYFRTIEQAKEAARRMKEVLIQYHEEIGE